MVLIFTYSKCSASQIIDTYSLMENLKIPIFQLSSKTNLQFVFQCTCFVSHLLYNHSWGHNFPWCWKSIWPCWMWIFILDKFGFNPDSISWIRILYSLPWASVLTILYRNTSRYIEEHDRTMPSAILQFDQAIKLFAIALRSNKEITGTGRDGVVHKLSLYIDNLVLYNSVRDESIPKILIVL